jgi:hypothetical protein
MNLDIRTKKTVAEGITHHIAHACHDGQPLATMHELEYCPGNGTRYHLAFATLEGEDCDCCSSWLVTNLNSLRSMLVQKNPEQLLHFNYVQEKLGCGLADAVCLAEIIGHITGRPYVSSEELERQDREAQLMQKCDELGVKG